MDAARNYHRKGIYLPGVKEYVAGLEAKPNEIKDYQGDGWEPVVPTEGLYELGVSGFCTVNRYNALVLNTRNLLIADIDFGDRRLSPFAGPSSENGVLANLADLHLLDAEIGTDFAKQDYRVYRTYAGCRVLCTTRPYAWEQEGWAAARFMRFLEGDPQYTALCGEQRCYRARLTPKPWREGQEQSVCWLVSGENSKISHDLAEQVRLHDELACS